MRSKAPLALIENAIMLVIFALVAAFCLQAFLWADETSERIAARDGALVRAESAAEVLKSCGGDPEASAALFGGSWDGTSWIVSYDEDWNQIEKDPCYLLKVTPLEEENDCLGQAEVEVLWNEDSLILLKTAWQEVKPDV